MPAHVPGDQAPADPPEGRELLSFGPKAVSRSSRRALAWSLVAVVIAAGVYGVYLLVPAPLPNFTSEDLLGAYAGMVRSDGENEVSLLDRSKVAPSPLAVLPVSCAVLFEQTEGDMFPMAAVDGVSTYWLNEGSASISLSTFRYPDAPTAVREFGTLASVVSPCADVVVMDR